MIRKTIINLAKGHNPNLQNLKHTNKYTLALHKQLSLILFAKQCIANQNYQIK